jgi:peptidoglycan/xylan/chitin deacetylase (PgdA/CDA1 family)
MGESRFQKIFNPLIRPIYGGIGHILMFHRICDPGKHERVAGASVIEYPPFSFATLLDDLISNEYRFISLDDLHEILISGKKSPEFIAVTFDDGYADNFEIAYPILKERQIPFTIYVTTSFPDLTVIPWWYLLEELLDKQAKVEFQFRAKDFRYDLTTPEGRHLAGLELRKLFKSADQRDLNSLSDLIFKKNGLDPERKIRDLAISWDQLRQLSHDSLATIGAHTINHLLLKNLSGENAREEILGGRTRLQDQLGIPINHFAYPFGGSTAAGLREFNLARESGFKTAVTTRQANIFPKHGQYLFSLPRLDMGAYPNIENLRLALDGWAPARMNHLKRLVTE